MNDSFSNFDSLDVPDLESMVARYEETGGQDFDRTSMSYLRFYLGNGINQIIFSFTGPNGAKFNPLIVSTAFGKFISNQIEMNVGLFCGYEDPVNSAYFQLRPFEYVFSGRITNHTRPIWSLHLGILLPFGFAAMVKAIEVRNIQRTGDSAPGTKPAPLFQLDEFTSAGSKLWLQETIQPSEWDYKKFTF